MRSSSSPNWPFSLACGFTPQTAMRGLAMSNQFDQRLVHQLDRLKHRADVQPAPQAHQRDVHRRQHDLQRPAGEHHRVAAGAGALGEQLGVAGIVVAGELPAFLGDRRGDDRVDQLLLRRVDRVEAEPHRRFAAHFAGRADGAAEHASTGRNRRRRRRADTPRAGRCTGRATRRRRTRPGPPRSAAARSSRR